MLEEGIQITNDSLVEYLAGMFEDAERSGGTCDVSLWGQQALISACCNMIMPVAGQLGLYSLGRPVRAARFVH
ncbi:hypothetical protein AC790_12735 [Pantoea sp. RIT-PI-b]|nr:hypothetical protein AC790_12735 [Pantoea sp. RIT-PI-b]